MINKGREEGERKERPGWGGRKGETKVGRKGRLGRGGTGWGGRETNQGGEEGETRVGRKGRSRWGGGKKRGAGWEGRGEGHCTHSLSCGHSQLSNSTNSLQLQLDWLVSKWQHFNG